MNTLETVACYRYAGMHSSVLCLVQEGAVPVLFGRHVSNQIRNGYSESWRRELYIGICMGAIGEGGGWWGGRGGLGFFGTPPQEFF